MIELVEHGVGGLELSRARHVRVHDDAGEVLRRQHAGVARDPHVAKAVKSEVRFVAFVGAALERVGLALLCRAQVGRVEVALAVQHFRVFEPDRRTCGTPHAKARPAHHVLSHVHHGFTGRRVQDLDGSDFLDAPDGGSGGRDEHVLAVIRDAHGLPVSRVESRLGPPCTLQARIVALAVIDVGCEDGPRRRLPVFIGGDDLLSTVREAHDNLRQERHLLAIRVAACFPREPAAIPAVAECDAYRVAPAAHEVRDVVRLVLQPLVVARPSRCEHLIANALAVDLHLVKSQCADVGTRGCHDAVEHEVGAEQGTGIRPR